MLIRATRVLAGLLVSLMGMEYVARARGWGLPTPSSPAVLRGVVVEGPVEAPTLVILGDSIPWGFGLPDPRAAWPVLVGEILAARGTPWRVVDVSIPGETSLQGWARWRRDVTPWRPQRVLIAFGLNDGHLCWTPADGRRWRGYPIGWGRRVRLLHLVRTLAARTEAESPRSYLRPRLEIEQTIIVVRDLVQMARRERTLPCVLTPTPVGSHFHPEWPQPVRAYQQDVYARLAAAIRRLGKEMNVPVIDLYSRMAVQRDTWLLSDGVHLTEEGHRYVANIVAEALSSLDR